MSAAHTAGPWTLVDRPRIGDGLIATVAARLKIVSAEGVSPDEDHANACLIAAAPDLLDALRLVALDCTRSDIKSDADRVAFILRNVSATLAKVQR